MPLDRSVVFLAKATSNLLFLLVVEVVAVPLFYFFFLTDHHALGELLAASWCRFSWAPWAWRASARSCPPSPSTRAARTSCWPCCSCPLIFPLLYACVSATTAAVVGAEGYVDVMLTSLVLAGGYDVIMILHRGFCTIS